MQIDKLLQLFIPQDKQFLPLLKQASSNLVEISTLFVDLLKANEGKAQNIIQNIESLEARGDDIRHNILHELSVNFITPFDREDILELAKSIDRIVDYIYSAGKRVEVYKIEAADEMISMASYIHSASVKIDEAVSGFKSMKKSNPIKGCCHDIHKIENQAEAVFYKSLGKLFENEKNVMEIIKIKEIFISMKSAINKCEEACDVIESIIVKNA